MRPILVPLLVALCLASCGEPERLTYQSGPIPLVATGPLFEGTNTAQGTGSTGLEAFLGEHGHSLDQLQGARLVGATIAGASDWPVSSPDPWNAIAQASTRQGPLGVLNAAESLDRQNMLQAYTLNAAKALRLEQSIGSIAPSLISRLSA